MSEDDSSLNVLDHLLQFLLCEHVEILAGLHRGELQTNRKSSKLGWAGLLADALARSDAGEAAVLRN